MSVEGEMVKREIWAEVAKGKNLCSVRKLRREPTCHWGQVVWRNVRDDFGQ